ncbi:hypothetical protein EV182_002324, partial [Spiromyces aspiralis]
MVVKPLEQAPEKGNGNLETPPAFIKGASRPSLDIINTVMYTKYLLESKRGLDSSTPGPDRARLAGSRVYKWDFDNHVEWSWCIQWLQNLIKFGTRQVLECHSFSAEKKQEDEGRAGGAELWTWDDVVDLSTSLLAELCGKTASGAVLKKFTLWDAHGLPFSVYVHEPSFIEANVGCQTWGSSALFSRRMARGEIPLEGVSNVLELGSGTGLCGFTTATTCRRWGWTPTVTMTDYLPSLITSMHKSAIKNGLLGDGYAGESASGIKLAYLDWFRAFEHNAANNPEIALVEPPVANYLDTKPSGNDSGDGLNTIGMLDVSGSRHKFDFIIAADVVYEPEQARVIPQLLQYFLSVASEDTSRPLPRAFVISPIRPTHHQDLALFVTEMQRANFKAIIDEQVSLASDFDTWCRNLVATGRASEEVCTALSTISDASGFDDSVKYQFW